MSEKRASHIQCPNCMALKNRVLNSRGALDGIRRRRECRECKSRFTTREYIEPDSLDPKPPTYEI